MTFINKNKKTGLALLSKALLLLVILSATFYIRFHLNNTLSVDKRHNYSQYYEKALAYACGGLDINNIPNESVEKKNINEFLHSKVDKLNTDGLNKYIKDSYPLNKIKETRLGSFNYYIAALVWKFFGISWHNLFYFYAFASTLAGLSLFFISFKITSSYWAGIVSLTTYAFLSPELYGGVWSIRDASPVWFFSFTLLFYYFFTGIYKNTLLNYLSYFLLGIVTLIGIGWRSDALLFLPVILLYLGVSLYDKYKKQTISLKKALLSILFFFFGAFLILLTNSKIQAQVTPFGFMHIALYAEDARSKIGEYENNFEYRVSDTVTKIRVEYYQEKTYPNIEKVQYMKGDYGVYCLELYIEVLKHNLYQWVREYPRYFLDKFLCTDVIMHNIDKSKFSFPAPFVSMQNELALKLWSFVACLAFIGGFIVLYIGKYKKDIIFLLGFIFYYSIVYWSMFPAVKHIMIVSIPISLLAGIVFIFFGNVIFYSNIRKEFIISLFDKNRFKKLYFFISSTILVYILLLFVSYLYSKHVKKHYINVINNISKDGQVIFNRNLSNSIFIDLKKYDQVGLLFEFHTPNNIGKVIVRKNLGLRWNRGQLTPTKYFYKYEGSSKKHKLFTVCSKMKDNNNIKVTFPSGTIVRSIKLIPLNNWNGIQYTTIFNDRIVSAGAKYIGDLN